MNKILLLVKQDELLLRTGTEQSTDANEKIANLHDSILIKSQYTYEKTSDSVATRG